MSVTPTLGLGLDLAYDDSESGTYDTIGHLVDISPPNLAREIYAFLRHDGPGYREKLPTLKEIQAFDFTVLIDTADTHHAALITAWDNGTLISWRITYTDTGAEVWTFAGFVSNIAPEAPAEEANRWVFTVEPSGALVRS